MGEALDGVPVATILTPKSAEEVAEGLVRARDARAAGFARGGGSKLGLGNPPRARELWCLALDGLDAPVHVQPDEGIATLAAGARLEAVEAAARAHGMRTGFVRGFPGATVGGTVAADPPGLATSHDRRLRNDVLGLEVALANGSVTSSGGRVVKNVTGFDLVRLYCGSFGTLGVITRATVRVRPQPDVESVYGRACADVAGALALAAELVAERVEPAGAVVVRDGGGARLFWRLEGRAEEVRARAGKLPGDGEAPESWSELETRRVGAQCDAQGRAFVRLGARPSDTGELVASLAELAGDDALALALPLAGLAFAAVPPAALGALHERAEHRRWLLVTERAPAAAKQGLDVFGPEPEGLPLMRALKRRFDPEGVLAPGRFVGRI